MALHASGRAGDQVQAACEEAAVNEQGERFMGRYEAAGDLASRDLVARAIVAEMRRTGGRVFLSMAHIDAGFVRGRFPTIAQACRQAGLDLAADRVPVSPATHYVMGGVETDLDGRVDALDRYSLEEKRAVTVPLVRELLAAASTNR